MNYDAQPDFHSLENNIMDVINEEQIKLGYQRETIRLYYPIDSLNHLLGTSLSIKDMLDALNNFRTFTHDRLGAVEFSNKDTRFCIVIPPEGVTYVHDNRKDNSFLEEIIQVINRHDCSIDDILEVFHHFSDHVIFEKVNNGEFDYLIHFEDGQPDSYLYCIKIEDNHAIYHRYTADDYKSFGF